MKCKYCGNDILFKVSGLKDFCSRNCKDLHRKKQQADWAYKNRHQSPYPSINSSKIDTTTTDKQTEKNSQNRPSVTYQSYGGREWYNHARKGCCNFPVREQEGYCLTLHAPYYKFKKPCSECVVGRSLIK